MGNTNEISIYFYISRTSKYIIYLEQCWINWFFLWPFFLAFSFLSNDQNVMQKAPTNSIYILYTILKWHLSIEKKDDANKTEILVINCYAVVKYLNSMNFHRFHMLCWLSYTERQTQRELSDDHFCSRLRAEVHIHDFYMLQEFKRLLRPNNVTSITELVV